MFSSTRLATSPPRGFTLLEVMVVMVLIGIITSFAVLSVGGGPRDRLAEEGRRLAALLELHQQEAILRSEVRGVLFTRSGYALLSQNDKGEWRTPAAEALLTRRELPDDLTLSLWVENRPVDLRVADRPQVWLLNSGEATEFVAVFGLADAQGPNTPLYRVTGDALGRSTVSEVNP